MAQTRGGGGWVGLGQGLIRTSGTTDVALPCASQLVRWVLGCPVSRPTGLMTAPVPGVDIIVTTLPGWGWGGGGGGGVEPGGSDDGMTITIGTFFALQVCVFAELDESAAALPPGFCTPFLAVSSQIVPHSPLRFFSLSQDIKCNFVPPCCLQKYHGFSPLLRSCYQHKCGCENCKQ